MIYHKGYENYDRAKRAERYYCKRGYRAYMDAGWCSVTIYLMLGQTPPRGFQFIPIAYPRKGAG